MVIVAGGVIYPAARKDYPSFLTATLLARCSAFDNYLATCCADSSKNRHILLSLSRFSYLT
jgi:hypothetical protein